MDSGKLAALLKRFPCSVMQDGMVLTCPVRVSFASLFEARDKDDGTKEFSACLIFPSGADITALKQAAGGEAVKRFGANAGTMGLINPIKPSATLAAKYDGFYEDGVHVNASSKFQPKMYDGQLNEISSPDDIYSGVWVRAKLRTYSYDKKGKRGVSFGLVSLQKIADDERFGADASEGFESYSEGPTASRTSAPSNGVAAPKDASSLFG